MGLHCLFVCRVTLVMPQRAVTRPTCREPYNHHLLMLMNGLFTIHSTFTPARMLIVSWSDVQVAITWLRQTAGLAETASWSTRRAAMWRCVQQSGAAVRQIGRFLCCRAPDQLFMRCAREKIDPSRPLNVKAHRLSCRHMTLSALKAETAPSRIGQWYDTDIERVLKSSWFHTLPHQQTIR